MFSLLLGHNVPAGVRILPPVDVDGCESSSRLSVISSQDDSSPRHSADEADETCVKRDLSSVYARCEPRSVNVFSARYDLHCVESAVKLQPTFCS